MLRRRYRHALYRNSVKEENQWRWRLTRRYLASMKINGGENNSEKWRRGAVSSIRRKRKRREHQWRESSNGIMAAAYHISETWQCGVVKRASGVATTARHQACGNRVILINGGSGSIASMAVATAASSAKAYLAK